MRQKRRPYREHDDDDEDALSDNLAAVNDRLDSLARQLERMAQAKAEKRTDDVEPSGVNERLDTLTRQIERIAQANAEKRTDEVEPSAVNERLDTLTRQLERIAQTNAEKRTNGDGHSADRVADALARLDRRLDQVIHEERVAPPPPPLPVARRARPVAPPLPPPAPPAAPPPPAPSRGPATWAAQIFARQRALEGTSPVAAAAPAAAESQQRAWDSAPAPQQHTRDSAPPPAPHGARDVAATDLSAVEQQLRQINSQISSLQQPYEDGLTALRNDLAEIGRALHDALPRQAIEALEADVRVLAERLDRTKQAGADGTALGTLEQGLAEVRDALRALTPAENLVGFDDAVRHLSHKIDQIASAQGGQDPLAFRQLEQAVVSLRGVVSNVATDGAMGQLAAEVRALAGQFERAAADSSTEALAKLETRIAALLESGRAMPPELEASIRTLSERLDRMQLSQGDQLALVALEDRIAKLSEKLDASDSRLRQFDAIERGLADLLVYLEEMRNGGGRGLRAAPAPAPEPAPTAPVHVPESPPRPSALPRSPLDLLTDLPEQPAAPAAQAPIAIPAPAPAPIPMPAPMPAAAAPPPPPPPEFQPPPRAAQPMPRARERAPLEPNLPPDTPLEPGSGTPRVKPGSPAARIAASEAGLGHARPAAEHGGKSAAIAAARNAAKAAYLDTPVKVPPGLYARRASALFKWPFKKRAKAPPQIPAQNLPKLPPEQPSGPPLQPTTPFPQAIPFQQAIPIQPAMPGEHGSLDAPLPRRKRVMRFLKTLLIAASVAIIVVGAAQTAFELLFQDDPPTQPASETQQEIPKTVPAAPGRPMPTPEDTLPPRSEPAAPVAPAPKERTSFFDPATVVSPKPPATEVTGSIGRQPMPSRPPVIPPVETPVADSTPASISPTLRTAAAANDPAAEYEMGARHAEGRGVPQSLPEAVRWFERAANAGFAPAQFRLASLNEKGDGLKKDLQTARRLYLAAAGKGHAKAMHNLAVLHAEGIDGKPDYKVAAQWFRKAAGYGVTDSQYNLAILYARGIGVATNLAESYKWFLLAAASGDTDAARKRDEVGVRLDQQTLMAAKLAAQTFVADREPDEATNLKAPPGGWDRQPATPVKPRKRAAATPAQ